jgi:hypothetical protein
MGEARGLVEKFSKRNAQGVERVETALLNCSDLELSIHDQADDMQVVLKWAASSGRGLEDSVLPQFSKIRGGYMQDMIAFFAYLAESFIPGTDVDEDIRLFSEYRTLRSREFAYKLALADEFTIM